MAALDRAQRLRYIAQELRTIRHDLTRLCGSDRVSEIRMVDDLSTALDMLIRDAGKPRSSASTVRRWHQEESRDVSHLSPLVDIPIRRPRGGPSPSKFAEPCILCGADNPRNVVVPIERECDRKVRAVYEQLIDAAGPHARHEEGAT